VIEAARRAVSPFLAYLTLVTAVYYLYLGSFLPGFFYARPISFTRFVESMYLLQLEGVFGMLVGASASYVVIFILFGAVISEVGVGDYFMSLAKKMAGRSQGGPAKIAIISSGFFGMISGSAMANVYACGSFTIPMMKKMGYRPQFAAAVEATASTGGQIMPPVMGVGAFIMAEFLNIPYFSIAKAAILPALLYYFAEGFMVHYEAKKYNLKTLDPSELPPWKKLRDGSYLVFPVVMLVGMMAAGFSAFFAAFISIFAGILVGILGLVFRSREIALTFSKLIHALESAAKNSILVAIACAVADIFTTSISQSGLGISFTSIVTNLSANNLLIALFIVAIVCLILGLGLPTAVAYILTSAIGCPVLIKLGCDPLAAHLFVFYFAVIGTVTPPECMAAYAAASIAGSNPVNTGWESTRLAITGFLVPFAFALDNSLLLKGPILTILVVFGLNLYGVYILGIGMEQFFQRKIKLVPSILLMLAGSSLFFVRVIPLIITFICLGLSFLILSKQIEYNRVKSFFAGRRES
jgi:TRAP transporter 4TM/12TM fusion protein